MAKQGLVTKIYELKVAGFDDTIQKFGKVEGALTNIKKAFKGIFTDTSGAAAVEQQIVKQTKAVDNSVSAYYKLNQEYKKAKQNAEDIAAEFGVESEQALLAAKSVGEYQQKLLSIKNLVKTGGSQTETVTTNVITTNNVSDEQARAALATGEAISELEKQEALAANEAFSLGQSQVVAKDKIIELGLATSNVKTKFEEYTGTIRQNILAQLENENALSANRASQKAIQNDIDKTGQATIQQSEKLASLREEEQLLIESNKALTLTIRNQAKEFIAQAGSLDEMQAQLNQLQQAYEGLSVSEKNTPFGVQLKKEIDSLEPAVKSLEAELGRFGRNVGNYPTSFTGAFKVLKDEIDSVQGKLVKGNFSGKEFDELTAKEKVLSSVTQTLNKEYSSAGAQLKAFKDASIQLGLAFGKDSEVFKSFSAQVKAAGVELKNLEKETSTTTNTSSKFVTGFKGVYGILRNIANIIPGLGIGSLVLLLITPLQSLATSFINLFNSIDLGKMKVAALNEVNQKAIDIYVEEKTKVESLASVARDNTLSLNQRKSALDQLIAISPNYLRGLTLENVATGEGKRLLDEYINSLQRKAELQASLDVNADANKTVANLNAEREALQNLAKNGKVYYDDLSEAQQKFIDSKAFLGFRGTASIVNASLDKSDIKSILNNIDDAIKTASGKVDASLAIYKEKYQKSLAGSDGVPGIIQKLKSQIEKLQKDLPTLLTDDAIKKNVEQTKKLQDQLDALEGKSKPAKPASLSAAQKNQLEIIDANLRRELATEETRVTELRKSHELSYQEELDYINNTEAINQKYLQQKIDYLSRNRVLNAKEKADLATFIKEKADIELKAQKDREAANKKQFDEDALNFKNQLDERIKDIQEANRIIQEDPTASATAKAQFKIDSDNQILSLQKSFATEMDALEKKMGQRSIKNAKDSADAIRKTQEDLRKDQTGLSEAALKDVQSVGEKQIAEFKSQIAALRLAVVNSNKSETKKNSLLASLDDQENTGILAREVANMKTQLPLYKNLLALKIITDTQYFNFLSTLDDKQKQLFEALGGNLEKSVNKITTLGGVIQSKIRDLLKIKAGTDDDKLLGETIAQTYSLAQDAMSSFFDAEANRISRNNKLTQERLDIELQQQKDRAQSSAEQASLDKQFQVKKEAADRDAFEKNKKLQIAQAEINLATQLSNIAVVAFAPTPPNLLTGGTYGSILYAIQAAIALAGFAINVNRIRSAQYEYGGEVPTKGGRFGGRPHSEGGTPFQFKGQSFEAEAGELAIIRTKNAATNATHTISGNHIQIASMLNRLGGGKDFAPGAKLKKFDYGGSLGEHLHAPVFVPSSNNVFVTNNNNSQDLLQEIKALRSEMNAMAKEQSKRVDRLEVVQVTSTVTNAQNKQAKQNSIGTL